MTAQTFQSRPFAVTAIQWRGDNEAELAEFAGGKFSALDPENRHLCGDPEATAQLLDGRNSTWKLLYVGDWIVKTDAGFVKLSDSAFTAQFVAAGTEPGS